MDRLKSLHGLTVIDLTQVISGASAAMMLADSGAEVIKIEPVGGEPYRRFGLPLNGEGGATNLNILRYSRGKKSVEIDLKSEEGKSILEGLIAKADVLIENFRPGVLERMGFPYSKLSSINRRLVYTTISGYGHGPEEGNPYRDRPAYAIITESMAGLTHMAGDGEGPPVWLGFAMADIYAGTLAFSGTLLALRERDQTGDGTHVDISMYDASLLMNDLAIAAQSLTGETMGAGQYSLQCPWGPYATVDGYVTIAVLNSNEWRSLCNVLGMADLADDPSLSTGIQRAEAHEERVKPMVEEWTRRRTKDQAAQELLEGGVPAAPVNTSADIMDCPQVRARHMLRRATTHELGEVELVGDPIRATSDSEEAPIPHIPSLGEHTRAVLKEKLGSTDQEIDSWLESNVIVAK